MMEWLKNSYAELLGKKTFHVAAASREWEWPVPEGLRGRLRVQAFDREGHSEPFSVWVEDSLVRGNETTERAP